MHLSRFLLLCACLLTVSLANAHEGHEHKPKPKPVDKGSTGKPDPYPGRTALAEVEPSQRFCMKNKEGKVHCIPFGPH